MLKKSVVSAITASLMVGMASTTFAATNPFSDVPRDSWAYDAVATLANDGVIDGFPDGTYQGQKTMTRYEMAQIIARAMAKTDLQKADKAVVDKLAVEFANELDNLGVRVGELEKKSDNVKWGGELKYKYVQENHDVGGDDRTNKLELKLKPKAYIGNSGWTANAEIKYVLHPEYDDNATDVEVSKAYVKGPLFGATVSAGKLPLDIAQGMIFDDQLSGVTAEFGSDTFKSTLTAGRYSEEDHDYQSKEDARNITAEYYGAQFDYMPTEKLALNAGYVLLNGLDKGTGLGDQLDVDGTKANLWYAGGSYAFDKNVAMVGQYLQNTDANTQDQAGSIELQYKGADSNDVGSWGAVFGYRHLGEGTTIEPTYDDVAAGQKGFFVGASYTLADNVTTEILYFNGKDIATDSDASTLYSNLKFEF